MKKHFILLVFLFLLGFTISDSVEAKTKKSPFEYETESLGNGTCRIVEIRITRDKGISVLKVPEKINGETVVSIGPGRIDSVNDDLKLQNVFLLTTYYCGDNPYNDIKDWSYKGYTMYYKPSQDYQKVRSMKIKKIILPDSIKEIKDDCFAMCKKLEKVKLPKNLETIGENAFSATPRLKRIHIPAKVKSGLTHTGSPCWVGLAVTGLPWKSFTISPKNPYYKMKNGCVLSKDGKVLYAPAKTRDVHVPDSVTTIGREAFYYLKIHSLYLGKRVKKIKSKALCTKRRCRVSVSPSNPYLAKAGSCIYYRKEKKLIAGIPKKGVLKISNKIKTIGNREISIVGMRPRLRKIYMPKSVKKLPLDWERILTWTTGDCEIHFKDSYIVV